MLIVPPWQRCALFVSFILLAFLPNECQEVQLAKTGQYLIKRRVWLLVRTLASHFCLVNISSSCAIFFLPEGLLCRRVALPASASCSFPGRGVSFVKPLLFYWGLFSKWKCWQGTAVAGGGCPAAGARGPRLLGPEGRNPLLEGCASFSRHLAGVMPGVSVMELPRGASSWVPADGRTSEVRTTDFVLWQSFAAFLAALSQPPRACVLPPPCPGLSVTARRQTVTGSWGQGIKAGKDRRLTVLVWETQKMGAREPPGLNWFLPEAAGGMTERRAGSCADGQKWAAGIGPASARQTGPSPPEAEGPETASRAKTSFHKLPCSSSSLYKLFILPKVTLLTMSCVSQKFCLLCRVAHVAFSSHIFFLPRAICAHLSPIIFSS